MEGGRSGRRGGSRKWDWYIKLETIVLKIKTFLRNKIKYDKNQMGSSSEGRPFLEEGTASTQECG